MFYYQYPTKGASLAGTAGAATVVAPAVIAKASLRLDLEHARQWVTRLVHHGVYDLRAPTDQELHSKTRQGAELKAKAKAGRTLAAKP